MSRSQPHRAPRTFQGIGKGGAPSGTYAMRNGRLTLIASAEGLVDPSRKLDQRAEMWTDVHRNHHPARKAWKKWSRRGFAICDGDADRREYQRICADHGYNREWVKGE